MKKPVVFLDRDGTLIEEAHFLINEQQIKVYREAIHAIKILREAGFLLIVLSNQSGVARGYLTEGRVEELNRAVFSQMRLMGAVPDDFYFCPYHPEGKIEKYRIKSDERKPGTGMIRRAQSHYDMDLLHAYSVGDKLSDVGVAKNLGGKGVLVLTGYGKDEQKKMVHEDTIMPDHIAADVLKAAEWIVEDYKKHRND